MGILAAGRDVSLVRGTTGRLGRRRVAARLRNPLFAFSSARTLGSLILAGLTFGILASVANHGALSGAGFAAKLIGSMWTWIALPYVAAWLGRRWWGSLIASVVFTLPAVWGYYLTDTVYGGYVRPAVPGLMNSGYEGILLDAAWSGIAGVTLGVAAATVVMLVRRGGILGVLAAGVVPGYIAGDAVFWLAYAPDPGSAAAVVTAGTIAGLAAVVAVGHSIARLVRGPGPGRRPTRHRHGLGRT